MVKKKIFAGALAASMVVTSLPGNLCTTVLAADDVSPVKEIEIEKTVCSNPIGGYDTDGNLIYGGDPAVLVDGDTVYLYTGHDTATNEAYKILEWMCYSTKDLKEWKYEGVTMKADKESVKWTSSGTDAWAGQVAKYKDKYYFYYCTWDATSSGKQSIGVAVSDSPAGPFIDKGEPLVKGTVTEPQTSNWNDIDPTVWIETDDAGVEHRYLAWGNGKYYVCELEEDMVTVKDLNGDGNITCGTSPESADIIDRTDGLQTFTEAPWLYRRKDENGKYYGKYYLFYAYGWREQMAYATTDNLLSGKWEFGSILMPPAATSNTNHMAVFDFQDKTYFVYHNGSLPGGSGFRRNACITEMHFNEDGSVQQVPETAVGISGTTSKIYSGAGGSISHENFVNSSGDGEYPYLDVKAGAGLSTDEKDAEWAITAGKADASKASYVSIQSENKPGLYLTVNDDKSVTLAQDAVASQREGTAKKQTFRTIQGLGSEEGVSFESVSQPGYYLTTVPGALAVTDGSDKTAATFYINRDLALEKRMQERFNAAKLDEVAASGNAEYEIIADDSADNCLLITRAKADAAKALKISIGGTVIFDSSTDEAVIANETSDVLGQADKEQIAVAVKKDVIAANAKASSKDASKKAVVVKIEGDNTACGNIYNRRAYSTENNLSKLTVNGTEAVAADNTYTVTIPYTSDSIEFACEMSDSNGNIEVNGTIVQPGEVQKAAISGKETVFAIKTVAEDFKTAKEYKLVVNKDFSGMTINGLAYAYSFDDTTDGAQAVTKQQPAPAKPAVNTDAVYNYTDGINGKAIVLDGTYGLKLCDAKELGNSYTISFWMKPDKLNGAVDPTLAAGVFSPEHWLNLTFDAKIWSKKTDYIDTGAANAYKAGQWQNVIVVVDGSKAGGAAGSVQGSLYVDGKLVSSGDVADGIMVNDGAEVYFGVNAWDAYFTGALDEVMMFNQALSADEAGAIADRTINISNAGTPAFKAGNAGKDDEPGNNTGDNTSKKKVNKVVITKKGSSKAVKTINLKKKKSVKLAAKVTVTGGASKKVKWSSSDKKLATVSAKGVVTAKNKKGTVKITATSKADSKKKCTVKIVIK